MRKAANDWAVRDLGTNPHDLFAQAVAELAAEARGTKAAVTVIAGTP
jgi:hypothetical protein